MTGLEVRLFGKLRVRRDGAVQPGIDARRVQELLAYLALYRDHPHPRERLADVIAGDAAMPEARKGLRQVLWKLQAVLRPGVGEAGRAVLVVDAEHVQLDASAGMWLDVAVLEDAWALTRGVPDAALDDDAASTVARAVEAYRGDLLDGWYHDWCLFERDRLQGIYLDLRHKLMAHAERHRHFESGIEHGMAILRVDRARERTHRCLMRLHYLAGDRSGALRQYERCAAALQAELGVAPARRTEELRARIGADAGLDGGPGPRPARGDGRWFAVPALGGPSLPVPAARIRPADAGGVWDAQAVLDDRAGGTPDAAVTNDPPAPSLEAVLADLIQLRGALVRAEQRVADDISAIATAMRRDGLRHA